MSASEVDAMKDLNLENQEVEVDDNSANVPQSRAERRSRKLMQGVGLKKIEGIQRVTLKRPRGHLYVVAKPEVFKSAVSDCYVIFGEVKNEDMSAFAQAQAAQMAQAQKAASEESGMASTSGPGFNLNDLTSAKKVEDDEEEDENAPIDETGVDQKDIDLVMEQVSCSRRKAVKALKENNGDLINAIMSVS